MTVATVYVLIALWPGLGETRDPATTLAACQVGAAAYVRGIAQPEGATGPAIKAWCEGPMSDQRAGFTPGWNCISGFNCR